VGIIKSLGQNAWRMALRAPLLNKAARAAERSIRNRANRSKTAFYDRDDYPFVKLLEDHCEEIAGELAQLRKENFVAWPENTYSGDWSAFGLYAFGKRNEENLASCPVTAKVLGQIEGLTTAGFSALQANTAIEPHFGYSDQVLRCHLALVVPEEESCALRVGSETRHWRVGESLIFDDTLEHEAWNRGSSVRIVLLLDFVKPGVEFTDQVLRSDAANALLR